MSCSFGMLCGKGNRNGHIRRENHSISIQCRGLHPQETCTLFRNNIPLETKTASLHGTLSFDPVQDGFFFLCGKDNALLLWEERENSTQSYYRALSLRPREKPPQPSAPLPPVEDEAPPLPEKEPLPPPRQEDAPSLSPVSLPFAPPAEIPPDPEPAFTLRTPSSAPPAFSLPPLEWPQPEGQRTFFSGQPFRPFSAPGFRCVRLPSPNPALPYCIWGFRTENSRVSALLYALPGHPLIPPRGFTTAQYRDGHFIRIQPI